MPLIFDVTLLLVILLTLLQSPTMPVLGRRLGLVRSRAVGELTVEAAPLDTMHAALLDLDIPAWVAGGRHLHQRVAAAPGGGDLARVRSGHTLVPDSTTRIKVGDRLLIVSTLTGARGHGAGAAVGLPCLVGWPAGRTAGPVGASGLWVGRGPQARPTRLATISADIPTSGSPPPGWADPPTRNRPGTGEAFCGRRNAARAPFDEVP